MIWRRRKDMSGDNEPAAYIDTRGRIHFTLTISIFLGLLGLGGIVAFPRVFGQGRTVVEVHKGIETAIDENKETANAADDRSKENAGLIKAQMMAAVKIPDSVKVNIFDNKIRSITNKEDVAELKTGQAVLKKDISYIKDTCGDMKTAMLQANTERREQTKAFNKLILEIQKLQP